MTSAPARFAWLTAALNAGSGAVPGPDAGLRIRTAGTLPPLTARLQPCGAKNAGTKEDWQCWVPPRVTNLTVRPIAAASTTTATRTGRPRGRRGGGVNGGVNVGRAALSCALGRVRVRRPVTRPTTALPTPRQPTPGLPTPRRPTTRARAGGCRDCRRHDR